MGLRAAALAHMHYSPCRNSLPFVSVEPNREAFMRRATGLLGKLVWMVVVLSHVRRRRNAPNASMCSRRSNRSEEEKVVVSLN